LRGATVGIAMLSMNDRWLLAKMTGPVCGTCSRPVTCGRNSAQNSGRMTNLAKM